MTEHKAITIKQPHVAAIFAGLKRFETRSWPTKYRGPLLIHAGKAVDKETWDNVMAWGNDGARRTFGDMTATLGCIIGVADLVRCREARDVAMWEHKHWGDFTPGRFAFELANPRLFKTPIPTRGQLGLWTYRGARAFGSLRTTGTTDNARTAPACRCQCHGAEAKGT